MIYKASKSEWTESGRVTYQGAGPTLQCITLKLFAYLSYFRINSFLMTSICLVGLKSFPAWIDCKELIEIDASETFGLDCSGTHKFVIRPPVRSNGRSYKMLVMFLSFFFSPRVLRVPSTDRPETLPPDRNLAEFYNASPKIRGHSPPKNWGQKHAKFRSILDHFRF